MITRDIALLLVTPAMFAAIPARAQTDAPGMTNTAGAASPAKAKKVVDPNKKICRTVDTTGSIMVGTHVCHTRAEWAAIDGSNSKAASDLRDPRGRYGGVGVRKGD